jgi:hypothetical protein
MVNRNKYKNTKKKKTTRIEKPIIFIGTGRSGTTIISEIIMRHRDLAFPFNYQNFFFMNPKINLIRNFVDNKFWKIYGQKKQLNKVSILNRYIVKPSEAYKMWGYLTGDDIDFSRGFLLNKKETNERISFIHGYFQKMIKYQNKKRLTFKITGPPRMEYLLSIFPDAYFIILKRKYIPTVSSFLKVNYWIKKIYEVIKLECKKCNPNYIEINYEDFVRKPREETIRILDFVNLKVDIACLNYLKKNRIYDRNKDDLEYFSRKELEKINNILNID